MDQFTMLGRIQFFFLERRIRRLVRAFPAFAETWDDPLIEHWRETESTRWRLSLTGAMFLALGFAGIAIYLHGVVNSAFKASNSSIIGWGVLGAGAALWYMKRGDTTRRSERLRRLVLPGSDEFALLPFEPRRMARVSLLAGIATGRSWGASTWAILVTIQILDQEDASIFRSFAVNPSVAVICYCGILLLWVLHLLYGPPQSALYVAASNMNQELARVQKQCLLEESNPGPTSPFATISLRKCAKYGAELILTMVALMALMHGAYWIFAIMYGCLVPVSLIPKLHRRRVAEYYLQTEERFIRTYTAIRANPCIPGS